jgi:hypothetical protein
METLQGLAGAVTQVWVGVLGSDATSAIWQMF